METLRSAGKDQRDHARERERVTRAMDAWSEPLWKLLLPSALGTKAEITRLFSEDAVVLSTDLYSASRIGKIETIPYDGVENATLDDETRGLHSLWSLGGSAPSDFASKTGEQFRLARGRIRKCNECRGQGRIRCRTCGGKIRWRTRDGDTITEHTCSCGDGKQNCFPCQGYGLVVEVLEVHTSYGPFNTKTAQYAGPVPQDFVAKSRGSVIFTGTYEFNLMDKARNGSLGTNDIVERFVDISEVLEREAGAADAIQRFGIEAIVSLVDKQFEALSNDFRTTRLLEKEIVPVRMRCQVTDVPVTAVQYSFKGKEYALHVYGDDDRVWCAGTRPRAFTWKMAVVVTLVALVLFGAVFASMQSSVTH